MNTRGIIRIQLKKVADIWNAIFKTDNTVNIPQDAIYDEIEKILPYYVVVECAEYGKSRSNIGLFSETNISGRIMFVTKGMSIKDDSKDWQEIDILNREIVTHHLFDIQPEVFPFLGKKCFRVPLGGVSTNNQKDINDYLHNLMFWESMLTTKDVGPLALRYVWVLEKLYNQKRALDDVKDFLKQKNAFKDKYEDEPAKGVMDICERLDAVSRTYQTTVHSAIADHERYIRDNEEKEMMLQQISEMNHFQSFIAMALEDNAKAYNQMASLAARMEENRRKIEDMEGKWADRAADISVLLKELLEKHGRD